MDRISALGKVLGEAIERLNDTKRFVGENSFLSDPEYSVVFTVASTGQTFELTLKEHE